MSDNSGSGSDTANKAIDAWIASQSSTAQQPRPWYPNSQTNYWSVPHGAAGQGVPTSGSYKTGGQVDWAIHDNMFLDKWNNDAKWRTQLVGLGLRTGLPNMTKQAGSYDFYKLWQAAGELSSQWADQGRKMSPMQVLQFLAGGGNDGGKMRGLLGGNGSGGGGGSVHTSSSTDHSSSVSYDISNAATAKALTNAVLSAALGREATPQELASYKAALNSAERAAPGRSSGVSHSTSTSVSDGSGNGHTTSNSRSSNTSYSSGLDSGGRQQVLLDKARGTAEGQAYQTNDVFNKALQVLAGL